MKFFNVRGEINTKVSFKNVNDVRSSDLLFTMLNVFNEAKDIVYLR